MLTVFTNKGKQDSNGEVPEGSGSGQEPDDTEGEDDSEDTATLPSSSTVKHITIAHNEVHETIGK